MTTINPHRVARAGVAAALTASIAFSCAPAAAIALEAGATPTASTAASQYGWVVGRSYKVRTIWSGADDSLFGTMDAIIKQMVGKYFGDSVHIVPQQDGTFNVIIGFNEYSSAIEKIVYNGQAIAPSKADATGTFTFNVPSLEKGAEIKVVIGGAMAGMFDDGVAVAMAFDSADFPAKPAVDKTALIATIAYANAIQQGSKTDAAYAALWTAITEAQAVADNDAADQAAVDAAALALQDAMTAFDTSADKPVEEPLEGPTAGPVDKPVEAPANEAVEGSVDKPAEQPADGPAEQPVEQPADEPAEKPAEGSTGQPTEKPAEGSVDQPTEKPVETVPADEAADGPTDKPAEQPADKPTNGPVDKPAEGPADQPAEKPAEKPADGPADTATDTKPLEEGKTYSIPVAYRKARTSDPSMAGAYLAANATVSRVGDTYTVLFSTNLTAEQKGWITDVTVDGEPVQAAEDGNNLKLSFTTSDITKVFALGMKIQPMGGKAVALDMALDAVNATEGDASVRPADTSRLAAAIADAKRIERGKKTDTAWNDLQAAIAAAQAVANNKDASQAQVDQAVTALEGAVSAFGRSAESASPAVPVAKPSTGSPAAKPTTPAPAGKPAANAAKPVAAAKTLSKLPATGDPASLLGMAATALTGLGFAGAGAALRRRVRKDVTSRKSE